MLFCRLKLRTAAVYHFAGFIELRLPRGYLSISCVELSLGVFKLLAVRLKLRVDLGLLLAMGLKAFAAVCDILLDKAYTALSILDFALDQTRLYSLTVAWAAASSALRRSISAV